MITTENSFASWTALAREDPERLVNQFFGEFGLLPPQSRAAFIASTPDHGTLIEQLQTACADEDAPLAGVPYMLQDLFDVEGLPTRCGAPFQDLFDAPLENSSLLDQTLKRLGGALFAKTVPAEFGFGLQGRNQSYCDCPHAQGAHYICGGGAGSCAHAVKAGWAPIAFGLDSSAGIRIPAAFHGLFAFRMGNNDYARKGVFPIVPSLESVGWVCSCADDLQTTIDAFYPRTSTPPTGTPRGYRLDDPQTPLDPGLKAGLMDLARHLDTDDDPEPNRALCQAFREANDAFTTIEGRELYAIHRYWIEESRALYDEGLLRQIEAGQVCTVAKSERATTVQQKVRETMVAFFQDYDYLLIPISSEPNPTIAEWRGQLETDLLRLNAPASLGFLPALILPIFCGNHRHSAVQLILNPGKIHQTASIIEQVKDFYS